MSTLQTTNLKNESSVTNNVVLGSDGSVDLDSGTLYVDAANNRVGVGTTSPSVDLHVEGTDAALYVDDPASGNPLRIKQSGTAGEIILGSLGDLKIGVGNTGDLLFVTGAALNERARITSGGSLYVGQSTTGDPTTANIAGIAISGDGYVASSRDGGISLTLNRITNDGTIVNIKQDGTVEGTISVSGTTVSYNGAHLSRWSQLPGGAERTEILRGTVLSNIDEMCAWGDEDNEQLNRMKVSDVEGDPNVSGVFQSWDDDDDTYTDDFYCAMTGDFIIRIAQGVTVQRGDLLVSAGDGTAKPQDDDIIRSKTIAKVTSTHVSCTYDDGSYCVPCVLMAC